jgi:hypothetical protein
LAAARTALLLGRQGQSLGFRRDEAIKGGAQGVCVNQRADHFSAHVHLKIKKGKKFRR